VQILSPQPKAMNDLPKSLKLAIAVDLRILLVLKWILDWMNDWLSLSRSKVEVGTIWIYGVTNVYSVWPSRHLGILLALTGLMTFMMWNWHRQPKAARSVIHWGVGGILGRIAALILFGFSAAVVLCTPPHHWLQDSAGAISMISYVLFLYILALPDDDGQRGKKRKMAITKLKELFGTSWIPQPVAVPQ